MDEHELLERAQHFRRLASAATDEETSQALLDLALEFEESARGMAGGLGREHSDPG